jgi:Cellulase M and related proteins
MADRPTAIKDALRETLRDLVALHGVSGFEQSLVQYFRQRVNGLAMPWTSTATATSRPPGAAARTVPC